MTHAVLMAGFCAVVGVVLGLILRRDLASGLQLGATIAGSMMAAGLAIAWVLYVFPL